MISAPGIYPGVPFEEYLQAHAVNSRLVQLMVERCPAAAYFASFLNPERPAERQSETMDAGTVAHACLLEGSCSRVVVVDRSRFPAKTTGAIPDGWTNQAIRAERDRIQGLGKIPMFAEAYTVVEEMVAAAKDFIESLAHDEPNIHAAFKPDGGESELTMLWDDDGVLCRMRPDRINTARTLIVDYKSGDGTAEPNAWGRSQLVRMGYYTGAAFYRRGVRALCKHAPEYVFLVQERTPPYLCSLVGVDEPSFALGEERIEYALDLWRKCSRARVWPSYPSTVCYPELPPWERARWEEFEAAALPYAPPGEPPKKSWEQQMREEKGSPFA